MSKYNTLLCDQALFHVLFLTEIHTEEFVHLKWSHFVSWQDTWCLDVFGKCRNRAYYFLLKTSIKIAFYLNSQFLD